MIGKIFTIPGLAFGPGFCYSLFEAVTMDTGGKSPEVPAIPVMRITLNNAQNLMQNSEYGEISDKMDQGTAWSKNRLKRDTGRLKAI